MSASRGLFAAVLVAATLGGCGGGGGGGGGSAAAPTDPPVPAEVGPDPATGGGTPGGAPVPPPDAAVQVDSLGTILTREGRVATPLAGGGATYEAVPPVRTLADNAAGVEYAVTTAGGLLVRSAASTPDDGPLAPILGAERPAFTAVAPFAPADAPPVTADAASFGQWHALVVARDGTVWSAGRNASNQLGRVPADAGTTFARVDVLAGVRAVAALWDASIALLGNGQVVSWGGSWVDSISGVILGRGPQAVAASAVPLNVAGLPPASAIAASLTTVAALGTDGSVWGWGYFLCSTDTMRPDPMRIEFPPGVVVTRVAASVDGVLALDAAGGLWYAGSLREPGSALCTGFSTLAAPLAITIDGEDPATARPLERIADLSSQGGLYPVVRGVGGDFYTVVRRAAPGATALTVRRVPAPVLP